MTKVQIQELINSIIAEYNSLPEGHEDREGLGRQVSALTVEFAKAA